MSLSYTYRDPFLADLVSQQNEDTAIADIAAIADFKDSDLETLVPYRAYVLCCIDNVKESQDIFATKKKMYEKEFSDALLLARSKDIAGVTRSLFSIPIERS